MEGLKLIESPKLKSGMPPVEMSCGLVTNDEAVPELLTEAVGAVDVEAVGILLFAGKGGRTGMGREADGAAEVAGTAGMGSDCEARVEGADAEADASTSTSPSPGTCVDLNDDE